MCFQVDVAQKDLTQVPCVFAFAVNAIDAIEKFLAKQYFAVITFHKLFDMMFWIKIVRETEQIPFAFSQNLCRRPSIEF